MDGKKKCELLKRIRKNIADKNDIDYEPNNCDQQDSCSGSCPKCDAEAEYLLNELKKKDSINVSGNIDILEKGDGHDYDKKDYVGNINNPIGPPYLVYDPETEDFVLTSQRPEEGSSSDLMISDTNGFA